eukprot:5386484-Amphidinium_carterae.1
MGSRCTTSSLQRPPRVTMHVPTARVMQIRNGHVEGTVRISRYIALKMAHHKQDKLHRSRQCKAQLRTFDEFLDLLKVQSTTDLDCCYQSNYMTSVERNEARNCFSQTNLAKEVAGHPRSLHPLLSCSNWDAVPNSVKLEVNCACPRTPT